MKISAFSKTYEGRTVLDFPGAEVQPGRIYAVIGANGSGKSTFAKILAGTLAPDQRFKRKEYRAWLNKSYEMATDQIGVAGYRLAALLNGLFDESMPKKSIK